MQSRNPGDAALSEPQITCFGGPLSNAGLHIQSSDYRTIFSLVQPTPPGTERAVPKRLVAICGARKVRQLASPRGRKFQIRPKAYKISRNPKQRIPKSQRATNQNQNGFSFTVKVQPRLLIFPVLQACMSDQAVITVKGLNNRANSAGWLDNGQLAPSENSYSGSERIRSFIAFRRVLITRITRIAKNGVCCTRNKKRF